jgi:hypothetical protein
MRLAQKNFIGSSNSLLTEVRQSSCNPRLECTSATDYVLTYMRPACGGVKRNLLKAGQVPLNTLISHSGKKRFDPTGATKRSGFAAHKRQSDSQAIEFFLIPPSKLLG